MVYSSCSSDCTMALSWVEGDFTARGNGGGVQVLQRALVTLTLLNSEPRPPTQGTDPSAALAVYSVYASRGGGFTTLLTTIIIPSIEFRDAKIFPYIMLFNPSTLLRKLVFLFSHFTGKRSPMWRGQETRPRHSQRQSQASPSVPVPADCIAQALPHI